MYYRKLLVLNQMIIRCIVLATTLKKCVSTHLIHLNSSLDKHRKDQVENRTHSLRNVMILFMKLCLSSREWKLCSTRWNLNSTLRSSWTCWSCTSQTPNPVVITQFMLKWWRKERISSTLTNTLFKLSINTFNCLTSQKLRKKVIMLWVLVDYQMWWMK